MNTLNPHLARPCPPPKVRNLSHNTRPEDLRYECERYGRVRDAYMPRNHATGCVSGRGARTSCCTHTS